MSRIDVDAFAGGGVADRRDEVVLVVVDGVDGAEAAAGLALGVRSGRRERDGAERARELNRRGADAARAAVDQDALARLQAAAVEQVGPHGEERFGNRGRVPFRDALGRAQALDDGDDAVLRVAAAAHQRADPLPGAPGPGIGGRDDLSADLQAGNIGGARRRRILAQPLHDVGPVDARGGHADEHFTGARHGHRTGHEPQDVRAARPGDLDRAHRRRDGRHRT